MKTKIVVHAKRLLTGVLAAAALLTLTACDTGAAAAVSAASATPSPTPAPSAEPAAAQKSAGSASKDETVYVLCGADGAQRSVIVSDWLKNPGGAAALEDVSSLQDIRNVEGDQTFTQDGSKLVWQADGSDIYYQGSSSAAAPVTIRVSYTLDGKTVQPSQLAGRSGRVVIRFDYTNNSTTTVKVNGQDTKINTPFVVLTGLYLDGAHFANISVENGKILNDGDRTLACGFALPGMSDNLKLARDAVDIPDHVTITADATDFSLGSTYSVVVSLNSENLQLDGVEGMDDLSGSLNALTGACTKLLNGSDELRDGLASLDSQSAPFFTGLATLSGKSAALNSGAQKVFTALLANATSQLRAAGVSIPDLTIANYDSALSSVLASLDATAVRNLATNTALQSVTSAVEANRALIRQSVSEAVRANVTAQVLSAAGMTGEQFAAAQAAVTAGSADAATQAAVTQINAQIDAAMSGAEAQSAIDTQTDSQVQSMINTKMASTEVQSQIEAAVASAQSGSGSIAGVKNQLDSYGAFYSGLQEYTGGVDQLEASAGKIQSGIRSLSKGAATLADGMSTFDQQGVQKLVNAFNGSLNDVIDRLDAIQAAGKGFNNFSGLPDGMDGAVKFLYKTDAIGE